MKARHILLITVLLFIPALAITAWGIAGNQKSGTSCMKSGCHNDLRADLHEQHPKVSAGWTPALSVIISRLSIGPSLNHTRQGCTWNIFLNQGQIRK